MDGDEFTLTKDVRDRTVAELTPDLDFSVFIVAELRDIIAEIQQDSCRRPTLGSVVGTGGIHGHGAATIQQPEPHTPKAHLIQIVRDLLTQRAANEVAADINAISLRDPTLPPAVIASGPEPPPRGVSAPQYPIGPVAQPPIQQQPSSTTAASPAPVIPGPTPTSLSFSTPESLLIQRNNAQQQAPRHQTTVPTTTTAPPTPAPDVLPTWASKGKAPIFVPRPLASHGSTGSEGSAQPAAASALGSTPEYTDDLPLPYSSSPEPPREEPGLVSSRAPEVMRRFLYPADNGDSYSQFQIGMAYLEGGAGVPKDVRLAQEWFLKAANLGYAQAQVKVAVNMQDGLLGPVKEQDLVVIADWYKRAADQGDTEGMVKLGKCYLNGAGVPKDEELAFQWFRLAARNGNARAQNQVGWCYWKGKGVEKNWVEAVRWHRISAESGHAEGETNMGLAMLFGWGGEKDPVKAIAWFQKAAENPTNPNVTAAFELGNCIEKGLGTPKDPEKALLWYRRAADLGNDKALEKIGMAYLNGAGCDRDTELGLRWLLVGAERNHAGCLSRLGRFYQLGDERVPPDHNRAAAYLRRAVELGDVPAKVWLGLCLETGMGVTRDPVAAVRLYTEAAKAKNLQGLFQLGLCHERGSGVPSNLIEADRCYKQAAVKEHAQAMASLGAFFEMGLGGNPKDLVIAFKYYSKAASKGDAGGMFKLGRCFELGLGIAKDPERAVKWYNRASSMKHAFAMTNLGAMLLNGAGAAVLANPAEGLRLLHAASDLECVAAIDLLSRCYASGVYSYGATPQSPKVLLLKPDPARAMSLQERARVLKQRVA
ncbi:hypothetical protein HK101_002154 [Irineochytrium annulatum]|nr:hypothetical protein HK101_002154 [Irineochytrium annulatum]